MRPVFCFSLALCSLRPTDRKSPSSSMLGSADMQARAHPGSSRESSSNDRRQLATSHAAAHQVECVLGVNGRHPLPPGTTPPRSAAHSPMTANRSFLNEVIWRTVWQVSTSRSITLRIVRSSCDGEATRFPIASSVAREASAIVDLRA